MPALLRAFRKRILTPAAAETTFSRRGFRAKDERSRQRLESAGGSFVNGFGHAAGAADVRAAEELLERIDPDLRGFAYEGAAMAFALMDGLSGGHRTERLLAGRGAAHVYMVHVGAGWAMARLPRFRRAAVRPADPLLSWLALDGYGFHQAYFHTRRWVREQYRDIPVPWPGDPAGRAAARVVDQGVGRALWFVESADPRRIAGVVEGFAAERRADLYSGVALAATYAGGVGDDDLIVLRDLGAAHGPAIAQGSAFAAKARERAGLTTAHTGRATQILCGLAPDSAAAVTDAALAELTGSGPEPDYLLWRRRIADRFVNLRRR
jgi:enediyne biosynthesis protein E3